MELEQLEDLRNSNELDLVYKIIDISEDCRKDAESFVKGKKAPGIRTRQKMNDVKFLATLIREKVLDARKEKKYEKVLNKAIEHAKEKKKRDREMFEKKTNQMRGDN